MNYSNNKSSGFSLVELLVVIGVIVMLLGLVLPNFMGARERARDSRRKQDIRQIQNGLELYRQDQSPPSYPSSLPACNSCFSSGANCTSNLYIQKFPCDPGSSGDSYTFKLNPNGGDSLTYNLIACLENRADPDRDSNVATECTSTTGASLTITQP